ncbi:hypothetical protein FACS18945_6170 [Bacteroidia bacterium]|nr:hypothetical protein FACS18945_6170 [Bacteroidia bacterium]
MEVQLKYLTVGSKFTLVEKGGKVYQFFGTAALDNGIPVYLTGKENEKASGFWQSNGDKIVYKL